MDASNRVIAAVTEAFVCLTVVLCASGSGLVAQAPPLLLECGVTQDASTIAPGQTVQFLFEGTAFTLVRFEVDKLDAGFKWNPKLRVFDPSGQLVAKIDPADELVLLFSGLYTLELFDGLSNGYGSARLRWQAITPAACAEVIECGEVFEGATPAKDFRNVHAFHGEANDLVSLRLEKLNKAEGLWSPIVRVYTPNGVVFHQFLPSERDKQAFTLPMSGDYAVTVGDVGTDGWGAYRLALDWIWPGEKACAPELFCGDKSSGATSHAGSRDIRRFKGEAGDRVHIDVMRESASFFAPIVELYQPNSPSHFEKFQGSKDVDLPSTGTYTVVVHDYAWDGHGTWRLELEWLLPTEKSCAPWLADCTPQGGQILGQDDFEYYRLNGTAGETVSIDLIEGPGLNNWAPKALLLDPSAVALTALPPGNTYVLPTTGTYTVAVKDKVQDSQGCYQVRVRRDGDVCPSPPTPACAGKTLEFVDLNAPEYAALPLDPSVLASGGRKVVGLAADGVTPVLIRANDHLLGPGTITFRVADDSDSVSTDSVGSLADPLSGATGNPLTVPLRFDATTGEWFGAAELTSPLNFARGPHDFEAGSRALTVLATASAGGCHSGTLTLLRPPVLLVHGIWGARETWRWPTLMREGASGMLSVGAKELPPWVQIHDYVLTHADPLLVNVDHLQHGIDSALRRFRGIDPFDQAFVAATQVDLVAHSMGGAIARLYCADVNGRYFRAENRLLGDVHKLVTLGSPHWGSPWADLITPVVQIPVVGDVIASLASQVDLCLDCGAVSDLQLSSLDTVPAATVPLHVVYGTGGTDLITSGGLEETTFDDEVGVVLNLFAVLHGKTLLDASQLLFGFKAHDMLVDVDSARAGLSGPRTTLVTGLHGMHTFMQKSWQVEAITARMLSERLDASDPASAFAPFIPPGPEVADFSPPYGALAAASLALPSLPDFVPFGVEMVPWFPSTGLGTGDVLPVEVRGVGGYQPTEVWVIAGGRGYRKQTSPFLVLVEMPADTVGVVPIYALAFGPGNFTVSADLIITMNPAPSLDKLYALPAPVFLTYDSPTVQLGVRALYTDGSGRLVDPEDDDLHFTMVPGGVASVDGEGRLSALAPGVTSVIVGYAGKTVTIPVIVVTHEGDDGTHALALRRDLAGNVGSLKLSGSKGGRPVLGSTLSFQLDLSTTGHAAGAILLRPDPLFYPAPGGQAVGIDLFSLPLAGFPVVPGANTVTVTVPAPAILIGQRIYCQGIHFGSAPTSAPVVAFSNTWDLRLGLE